MYVIFYTWHLQESILLLIFVEFPTGTLHVLVGLTFMYGRYGDSLTRGNGLIPNMNKYDIITCFNGLKYPG